VSTQMDVFVIHMSRRTDRMLHLKKLQSKYPSIRFNIVNAITHPNPGQGCNLSHQKIVQMAKDRNLPYVIVLEDDCDFLIPDKQLKEAFESCIKYLNDHPDVQIINGCGNLPEKKVDAMYFTETVRLFHATEILTTHCMVYGATSYDTVLALTEESGIIDSALNDVCPHMLFTYPYLATQIPSYSDLQKTNVSYENIKASMNFIASIV